MRKKDPSSKGSEYRWNMPPAIRAMRHSILDSTLIFSCILSVALFHHSDAVIEGKTKDETRDHRVTLLQVGIVPGIVDYTKQTTLRYILSSSPSHVTPATTSSTTSTTNILSQVPPPTSHEKPAKQPAGKPIVARKDCCVVGQIYARTNMSCEFTTATEHADQLKGSDPDRRGGHVARSDAVEGRVNVVGSRIDRMLRKCRANDYLDVHLKRCCRNEQKSDALQKCRRLTNARKRRLCRMGATKKN